MFVKFDNNNNCIKYGSQNKKDESYLEIGIDIEWIVDIKRQGSTMTINVKDMLSTDEILYCYNEKNKIKKEGNTIRLKTIDELKLEKYRKLQNEMLNNPNLRELRNAITFQEITKGKGSNPSNAIFTDTQMKNWGDYFGNIAKDNHDLSNLTLEEINPSMFGEMPEIPIAYQNILI